MKSGGLLGSFQGNRNQTVGLTFISDGKVLVIGGDDGTISLWDMHVVEYCYVKCHIVGRVERSETRQMSNAHLALIWTRIDYVYYVGFRLTLPINQRCECAYGIHRV